MSEQPAEGGDIVWQNTVDGGKFATQVVRTQPYRGQLTVVAIDEGTMILDEEVGLSFDAIFGPDTEDLSMWMHRVIEVIDAHLTEEAESIVETDQG